MKLNAKQNESNIVPKINFLALHNNTYLISASVATTKNDYAFAPIHNLNDDPHDYYISIRYNHQKLKSPRKLNCFYHIIGQFVFSHLIYINFLIIK